MTTKLTSLTAGMPIPYGGDRVALVSAELAQAFQPGDRLVVVQETGALLHVPAAVQAMAEAAVGRAYEAFQQMGAKTPDEAISAFFEAFAARLKDEASWARHRRGQRLGRRKSPRLAGRSVTRLVADEKMRQGMIEGLRGWRDAPVGRGKVIERVEHAGWSVEQVVAPLGVVAFVFEGRPNVFADATGVLRGGNTVVFRIGSDALGTAKAIVEHALAPALMAQACPPRAAAVLVESAERGRRLGYVLRYAPVAGCGPRFRRCRGPAGRGGAPGGHSRQPARNRRRLDGGRPHGRRSALRRRGRAVAGPQGLQHLERLLHRARTGGRACAPVPPGPDRGGRATRPRLQAACRPGRRRPGCPPAGSTPKARVRRAEGDVEEHRAEVMLEEELGREWEWEETPEVSFKIVDSVDEAIALFNRYSPQFVASLVSADGAEHQRFYQTINAPFVGDGFTRWVDGQYALDRPELGLSNWQFGRLFARGGVLAGDGVFTVRYRMRQTDPKVRR